jgi:hypothetical protein
MGLGEDSMGEEVPYSTLEVDGLPEACPANTNSMTIGLCGISLAASEALQLMDTKLTVYP